MCSHPDSIYMRFDVALLGDVQDTQTGRHADRHIQTSRKKDRQIVRYICPHSDSIYMRFPVAFFGDV